MTVQEVFIRADEALNDVVQQIKDEQWDMTMPEDFAIRDNQKKLTLREVINYHAYDEAWVPNMVAGKTMDDVGKDRFDGDLLGDNPKQNFAALVQKAVAAVRALDDTGRMIHFSYGDYPASEALKHIAAFRGMRVYDISKAIGLSTKLPDELVKGLWLIISPDVEEWRKMGVFPPKIEVPDDAPLQQKLLGLTGRKPEA